MSEGLCYQVSMRREEGMGRGRYLYSREAWCQDCVDFLPTRNDIIIMVEGLVSIREDFPAGAVGLR